MEDVHRSVQCCADQLCASLYKSAQICRELRRSGHFCADLHRSKLHLCFLGRTATLNQIVFRRPPTREKLPHIYVYICMKKTKCKYIYI